MTELLEFCKDTIEKLDITQPDCRVYGTPEACVNFSFIVLATVFADGSSDKVKFWMKLNKGGRGQLLKNSRDRKLWTKALLDNQDEIDTTFWLLSTNPLLLLEDQPG